MGMHRQMLTWSNWTFWLQNAILARIKPLTAARTIEKSLPLEYDP